LMLLLMLSHSLSEILINFPSTSEVISKMAAVIFSVLSGPVVMRISQRPAGEMITRDGWVCFHRSSISDCLHQFPLQHGHSAGGLAVAIEQIYNGLQRFARLVDIFSHQVGVRVIRSWHKRDRWLSPTACPNLISLILTHRLSVPVLLLQAQITQ